jgi:hypothetical protein
MRTILRESCAVDSTPTGKRRLRWQEDTPDNQLALFSSHFPFDALRFDM